MHEADAALDTQRAELRAVLRDLDLDLAETEGKLGSIPRGQAQRRAAVQRNLDSMTARYEAADAKLAELGEASARPDLPELVTAEEWDDGEITPPAAKRAVIENLGLRVTILPVIRAQGSSRLPFDERRVQITRSQ
jgi:hypothetical protein